MRIPSPRRHRTSGQLSQPSIIASRTQLTNRLASPDLATASAVYR